MPQQLLRRLLLVVPVFLGITVLTFFLIRLAPGDPILLLAGEHGVSAERYAELQHQFGFDRPLYEQFVDYLWQVLNGNLGTSVVTSSYIGTGSHRYDICYSYCYPCRRAGSSKAQYSY
jgi:ABC-type dipeptide/oligopeptide/nickel transport system permease component